MQRRRPGWSTEADNFPVPAESCEASGSGSGGTVLGLSRLPQSLVSTVMYFPIASVGFPRPDVRPVVTPSWSFRD